MKVLHLTAHLNTGGMTSYIFGLVRPLSRKGIQLSVMSSGGSSASMFHEAGAETFEFPVGMKSELHPRLYASLPSILKFIREKPIDILHAHTRVTQVLAFWVQKFAKIPVVTTCHGFYKKRMGRRLLPAWGDRVIAISDDVRDHLISDFKIPARKVRLIYNGIDLDSLDAAYRQQSPEEARASYGFKPQDLVIVMIARLVRVKGQENLIRAVNILRKEFPAVRLLLVGEGDDKSRLVKLVEDLYLSDRVFFTGGVHNIVKPLAAADLFALPALWREAFGLSILEAMACRKPVIVTRSWALAKFLESESAGILVDPAQVGEIVQAASRYFRDKGLRERAGDEGRRLVERQFGMDQMAQNVAALYEECCSENQFFVRQTT
ncbi:MAG TPA: glycosyltransferase family 4 protein [bacterium]|nr:glycosyltransferase family 4 protein [bacterium]